jgi:DNA-binding SARP family transcriptional activator
MGPDGSEHVGILLREYRQAAQLTQRQLAESAAVSISVIRDLEQGRTKGLRGRSLGAVVKALGLDEQHARELEAAARGSASLPGGTANDARQPSEAAADGPRLRLAVLGPLTAIRDGTPMPLGPLSQRAVLALLAISPGELIHRASLIDVLWGDMPPRTAVTQVQRHLSGLRRILNPGRPTRDNSGLLVSTGACYRLRATSGQLDLLEFRDLTRRAEARRSAGDAESACDLYEEALSLWRGDPLADIGILMGHPAVTDLNHQRAAVTVAYGETTCAAGRYERAVPRLQQLASRELLHEQVHALLMIALAGNGQQAAALEVFENLRRRLDEQLGVGPSAELSDAHLRVLRGDVPRATRDQVKVVRSLVPRQLPAALSQFVGRQAEQAELNCLLGPAPGYGDPMVISVISGTAGVGKTALALHWAHQVSGHFPDGQLYVNLCGFGPSGAPVWPGEAIRGFLNALGVPPERVPASEEERAALFRSLVAGKRMLIVLDNARDTGQVRPLLPGSPGCLVVVTSRSQLASLIAAEGARRVTLDVFTEAEARELLVCRLGIPTVTQEPEAVTGLIRLCARLPLALAIVAARAAVRSYVALAMIAAELEDASTRLDALDAGEPASSIRAVFAWSYQSLTEPAACLFRLLGLHPGPAISAPAAASLAGVSHRAAGKALGELTGAQLLSEHAPGRFAFHDLLRAYAAEQAGISETEAGRRAAIHRMLDHYLHTARAASLLLHPYRSPITLSPPQPQVHCEALADRSQALAWFRTEREVLLAVSSLAADGGFGAHAWQLPWAMAAFLYAHGYWQELVTTQGSALDFTRRDGDLAGQAEAHRYLGQACQRLGSYADAVAHLTETVRLCGQLGSSAPQARAYLNLSNIFDLQDRVHDALSNAERSLKLYRAAGHQVGEAQALNAVGWCHLRLGNHQNALDFCERALAVHRELGNWRSEAVTLDSIGCAHYHLGHYREAIACYQQAIEVQGDEGDRYAQSAILTRLGDAQLAAADSCAARNTWRQALAILEDLHLPDADQVRAKLDALAVDGGHGAG